VDDAAAEAKAGRLNAEHPERERFRWVAFPHKNGAWTVIKTPRSKRVDPLTATTEAKPKPREQEPPWGGPVTDLPGYR
jgi:hypothetical protein